MRKLILCLGILLCSVAVRSQNVGIGTTTPGAKLEVVGGVKVSDSINIGGRVRITSGTPGAGKVLSSDANGLASWQTPVETDPQVGTLTLNKVPKWNGTTLADGIVYDNGTNLGIGTTGPVTKFQLNNKVTDDNGYIYDAGSANLIHPTPTSSTVLSDPKTILMLSRQGTSGQSYGAAAAFNLSRYENAGTNTTGSRTRLDIRLAHDGFMATPADVMTLLSNGNVGIGTTTPSNKLSVYGTSDIQVLGVGTTTPAASAVLDASSTSKGFLPPRMDSTQRNAIAGPVAGLIVFCTNCGQAGELNVYDGFAWTNMLGKTAAVTTTAISQIRGVTATSGGNISSNGGLPVTARGVCWSTSANPTTKLLTKTNNGTGPGIFPSSITGLSVLTTYHVRAYATNSLGRTSYGGDSSFTTTQYQIGESYGGGILAYILQPGDPGYIAGQFHGLIAAPSDQSTGIQWYNGTYVTTEAIGTAIGTGLSNTNTIISGQGAGSYAAKLCKDLVLNGYSDWYLPSRDELNKLYIKRALVGGFANWYYWSSTETGSDSAWSQAFSTGYQNFAATKHYTYYVRAVRAF